MGKAKQEKNLKNYLLVVLAVKQKLSDYKRKLTKKANLTIGERNSNLMIGERNSVAIQVLLNNEKNMICYEYNLFT